jgi:hypothetical protein
LKLRPAGPAGPVFADHPSSCLLRFLWQFIRPPCLTINRPYKKIQPLSVSPTFPSWIILIASGLWCDTVVPQCICHSNLFRCWNGPPWSPSLCTPRPMSQGLQKTVSTFLTDLSTNPGHVTTRLTYIWTECCSHSPWLYTYRNVILLQSYKLPRSRTILLC